jgi:hypothetical protein
MKKTLRLLNNFDIILNEFNRLVASSPSHKSIGEELIEIKSFTEGATSLNSRQKGAILDRIKNYQNGSYGNSKAGYSFTSPQETKK